MYKPRFFNEDRIDTIHGLIREYSFAPLISPGESLSISHLPFLLEVKGGKTILLSHMAKANPHWRLFEKDPRVLVVFQGPHAYISPAWYPPDPENVPTWNYSVVHAHGNARIISDDDRAEETMRNLITINEKTYGEGWQPDFRALRSKMPHIVVFEIEATKLDAKFKLSQQQNLSTREGTARKLLEKGDPLIRRVGEMMLDRE